MAGELVGGGWKPRMASILPVLGCVAVCLPVFDPDAHGKGLCLHRYAPVVEHFEGVPGRMAGGENQMAAGQEIGPARALHTDASQAAIPEIHVDQPAFKPDIRSQFQKLLPQVLKGGFNSEININLTSVA